MLGIPETLGVCAAAMCLTVRHCCRVNEAEVNFGMRTTGDVPNAWQVTGAILHQPAPGH